eukprot:g75952.t1
MPSTKIHSIARWEAIAFQRLPSPTKEMAGRRALENANRGRPTFLAIFRMGLLSHKPFERLRSKKAIFGVIHSLPLGIWFGFTKTSKGSTENLINEPATHEAANEKPFRSCSYQRGHRRGIPLNKGRRPICRTVSLIHLASTEQGLPDCRFLLVLRRRRHGPSLPARIMIAAFQLPFSATGVLAQDCFDEPPGHKLILTPFFPTVLS